MSFFGIKGAFFAFFSKTRRRICAKFFQDLGANTSLLQPALKSNAPSLWYSFKSLSQEHKKWKLCVSVGTRF